MSKTTVKRGRKPVKRAKVICELAGKKLTSGDLGVPTAFMDTLETAGLVNVVAKQPTGGRGRDRNVYGLTRRGALSVRHYRNIAA